MELKYHILVKKSVWLTCVYLSVKCVFEALYHLRTSGNRTRRCDMKELYSQNITT